MSQGLNLKVAGPAAQTGAERSFVGGAPMLAPGVPVPHCSLCSEEQMFFLLITLPDGHEWANSSIAVFACTACATEDSLIPEMLSVSLPGADVPAGFLARYQTNFRFLVFDRDSARSVSGYTERVGFRELVTSTDSDGGVGRVGGAPRWVMADESPGTVAGSPATFLFQLYPGLEFELVDGAPAQVELGLDGTPEPSPDRVYRLFLSNALYLWGPDAAAEEVYALTQVD